MDTRISIIADNNALSEVQLVELFDSIKNLTDVKVESYKDERSDSKISRFTGLEVLATFITSAAAYQLALAVRDFVKRQHVYVRLKNSDGDTFVVDAQGGDSESVAKIVGFLNKQYKKKS